MFTLFLLANVQSSSSSLLHSVSWGLSLKNGFEGDQTYCPPCYWCGQCDCALPKPHFGWCLPFWPFAGALLAWGALIGWYWCNCHDDHVGVPARNGSFLLLWQLLHLAMPASSRGWWPADGGGLCGVCLLHLLNILIISFDFLTDCIHEDHITNKRSWINYQVFKRNS